MAKTTTTENTQNETPTPTRGARILKHGLLASACVVQISGAPKLGNYGKYDVPFLIDGQRFILPMATANPQWADLLLAFGEPSEWTGCTVRVGDSKMLRQVNIEPVATANGKPVS